MKNKQRGDSDIALTILLLFVLFWGEPDVWDALQHWAKASVQVQQAAPAKPEKPKGLAF